MTTLLRTFDPRQTDVVPIPETDQAWLASEKRNMEAPGFDPHGARECAAAVVWDLTLSIRFFRVATAADLLADQYAPYGDQDLDPRIPTSRQSTLAQDLDEIAAYWIGLDTTVSKLCASELLRRANQAEDFGSETFDDYIRTEAAWEMAVAEEAEEAYRASLRHRGLPFGFGTESL